LHAERLNGWTVPPGDFDAKAVGLFILGDG